MEKFHKVIIIGAGPTGLYFASKLDEKGIDYLVIEGCANIGGQLTRLYPEKLIVDIPGIENIAAKDYIALLAKKVNPENIVTDCRMTDIKNGKKIEVFAGNTVFYCEKLVICTGLGTTTPRLLGVEHETECSNIIYSTKNMSQFKDKRVAIFGGGDSALDWAKALSKISNNVHLIHRRTEFRGNPETIKDCKNLKIYLPYVPHSIEVESGRAISIKIKKVDTENEFIDIPVDYIFVNYGNIASQSKFPFNMEGAFISVGDDCLVEKNVFAIGDVCQYENKTRRIAPGIKEADKVLKLI